jgi:hypothetical protein
MEIDPIHSPIISRRAVIVTEENCTHSNSPVKQVIENLAWLAARSIRLRA